MARQLTLYTFYVLWINDHFRNRDPPLDPRAFGD